MNDPCFQADLRRYWDEIAQDGLAAPGDLDPDLVDTIRRLHAMRDVPPPDPTYAARLRESLIHAAAMPLPRPDPLARPDLTERSTLPARPAVLPPVPVSHGRRALAHLATAALLLLTMIGGFLVFGPGRSLRLEHVPAILPALVETPATPQTVITETVLDATMDALPSGHNVVAVERWRLQPGSVPMTRPPSTGVVVIAAESGEITANQAGIAHQLAAGEPFTLAAQEASLRASGPDEATAFMVTIYAGANNAGHASERWDVDPIAHAVDYPISTSADALPGGAGRIVLERLTLPPGSALPPQEANPLVWTGVGAGVLGLTLEGEHLPFRWKSGAERTFRPGQYLPPIQPGTHLTLRNAGEDPLILYRLTLTPRGTGGPTVGTLAP